MKTRAVDINRDKLRAAIRRLPDEFVRYPLEDAINHVPPATLSSIVREFVQQRTPAFERDDNDTVLVRFPNFPEAHTFGDDEKMRRPCARNIADRRAIPSLSARRGHRCVPVPALMEAKVRLYEVMRKAKVGKADFGATTGSSMSVIAHAWTSWKLRRQSSGSV